MTAGEKRARGARGGRRLGDYEGKRDFASTPEPSTGGRSGASGRGKGKRSAPRFVVQEHSARRLHWDLRLERDGVAASWAIPNGIPEDPEQNRKAIRTEDHPLEYLEFEGEIPAGEYGAGTVRIWDRGAYECEKWEEGKVMVSFAGERLRGRYALFRAGGGNDWMIHRIDPPEGARDPFPESVVPMLARLAELPARDDGWAVEVKWDGVRAIAYCRPGRLELQSRNLRDVTAQYPEVRRLARQIGAREAVLDGELVAFDEEGRPSFERLQQRIHQTAESVVRRRMKTHPVTYAIFDLLHLDGRDLMGEPYRRRRELLEGLELSGPSWQTPAYSVGRARELLAASRERGLEGVVLKRLDSRYAPGRRTGSWLKVKNVGRQEFAIGGWLPGEGRRRNRLGALLLGYFDPDDGGRALRYAGKVGTGFSEADLDELAERLAPLARKSNPFAGGRGPRAARFVEPRLVAEIEFRELTAEGMIRHGSFKGLREDKPAVQVGLERLPERARWYARIADVLLPHLHGRRVALQGSEAAVDDLPGLLDAVERVGTELRVSLATAAAPERPTAVVFDLEPGPKAGAAACCEAALWIRGMLEQLGLNCFAKSAGAKGLQLQLPLNTDVGFEQTGAFARAVAATLESRFPERIAAAPAKGRRSGRVAIAWGANERGGAVVCPYSLLAGRRQAVAAPLEWEEVEAVAAGASDRLEFDPAAALGRVEEKGDLFAPVLHERQSLPEGFGGAI